MKEKILGLPLELYHNKGLILSLSKMILRQSMPVLISELYGRLFSRLLQLWYTGLYLPWV